MKDPEARQEIGKLCNAVTLTSADFGNWCTVIESPGIEVRTGPNS